MGSDPINSHDTIYEAHEQSVICRIVKKALENIKRAV